MRTVQLILSLLFLQGFAMGQQQTITGKIVDVRQQPVANANIVVLSGGAGNKAIKGGIADTAGRFSINLKDTGLYIIKITAVGYAPYTSAPVKIDATVMRLPVIVLAINPQTNKAVVVQAKKKFIEIQADKTVLNIENSIVAVGNSAFELIKKAPAVTVDKDDNLKLKGGIANIYIDGKPFYLAGEQLVQYLKNLQADAISKIEIISNPSSKYDAAGQTGIINIRLRKNKQYGTNGSLAAGSGYGRYPKASTSLSLNHRNKSVNIFTDASLGYSESFNKLTYNSVIADGTATTYQDRSNYWHPKTTWSSFKAGMDYVPGKKIVVGILIKGNGDNELALTDNETTFSSAGTAKQNSIITAKRNDAINNSMSYNLNLKADLDSAGSELTFDADYIRFKRRAENTNANIFRDATGNNYRIPYTFRNQTPADIHIKTVKLDFTKVYNKEVKLEAGAKYSTVQNDNYLKVDSLDNAGQWAKDLSRTNTFLYTERIAAGYINFTRDWKRISLQMGLRAENTNYTGNSITLNQVRDSNYTNLFPSVFLTYRQNDRNTWNASYSRRINRPSYQSLNPFIDFIDPFTQFEGNPGLKPSFTQSLELKHSYNDFLYTTLSYSHTRAQSTNVIIQDKNTGAVRNITANVGNATYASLNVSASFQPLKWWSMDNNLSFSGGNSNSNYPGYAFNQNFFSIDIGNENTFQLPRKIKIQTSAYYSTPYRDGITRVRSSYIVSGGVQKSLWDGRASIRINYNNIIGPSAYRARYLGAGLNIKWINQWEGRRISLNFSYKFGSSAVKASRQRRSASQEERNRVNL